jgi:hypothetical protein
VKAIAAFVMRGRLQAAAVAAALALLGLAVTPLALVCLVGSGAAVGLMTLRVGVKDGLLVSLIAALAMAIVGAVTLGEPVRLGLVGVGIWLPVVGLAAALRHWRSLPLAVELAVLAGFGLVLVQYLPGEDPALFWAEVMRQLLGQVAGEGSLEQAQLDEVITALAPWMVGGLGAVWALQLALTLFLARSWQAVLYNPGGFREEFRALRLGRWLGVLVPLLLIGGVLTERPGLPAQLSLVGMAAFLLQGVALVHGAVAALGVAKGWLIGFYILLFIALPHSFTAVSAAGFADSWLDFRKRMASRRGGDDRD